MEPTFNGGIMKISFEGHLGDVLSEMKNFLTAHGTPVKTEKVEKSKDTTPKTPKETPKVEPEETAPAFSTEELAVKVKALGPQVAKAKGRQAVVDLLAKYHAKTGADVKPEHYLAFIQDAEALLK